MKIAKQTKMKEKKQPDQKTADGRQRTFDIANNKKLAASTNTGKEGTSGKY